MATITTDTYLDGGTARTAGESWSLTAGSSLTIRTDSRIHANAPAGMTGSLGIFYQISPGSNLIFDSRNVRWMPFDTGTGTCPAIGTSITQGGVSGYFLGVWSDVSTYVASGAAMPATGFIKFREVTGGPFTVGALTGISANAKSADVVGWIEVVFDIGLQFYYGIDGGSILSYGDWFTLGTTTGAAGQVVMQPATGTGSLALGVQIETSPGSGVYEWYPAEYTTFYTVANLCTDKRARVVRMNGNTIVIGTTAAATNAGYVPPAGCKIRIPNIFIRQCATASRTVNASPSTTLSSRPSFCYTSGAAYIANNINLQYVSSDWVHNIYYANNVSFTNCSLDSGLYTIQVLGTVAMDNVCFSQIVGVQPVINLAKTITLNNVTTGSGQQALILSYCGDVTLTGCELMSMTAAGTGANSFSGLNSITLTNCKSKGIYMSFNNCKKIDVTNFDYTSCMAGTTTASRTGSYPMYKTNSGDMTFSGLTFGDNGTLATAYPYSGLFYIQYNQGSSTVIKNTNVTWNDATYGPQYLLYCGVGAESSNVYFKRCSFGNFRGQLEYSDTGASNINYVNMSTTANNGLSASSVVGLRAVKGCHGPFNCVNMIGTSFIDYFPTTTTGKLTFKPSQGNGTLSYGGSGSNKTAYINFANLMLKTVGDNWTFETPYTVLGHTAFANIAPSISTNNVNYYTFKYQLDAGSGYGGTWKTLNTTNLTAETISPSTGFKLKIQITCTTANTNNYITSVEVSTVSTATAQTTNLYPLDVSTLSFTGLIPGSEVRCYTGTDPATAVEIGSIESTSGSTFSFTHSSGGSTGHIVIFAMGYQPIYLDYTYKSTDDSILIQPVIDRNYVNPV